jgi:hypothetical protein
MVLQGGLEHRQMLVGFEAPEALLGFQHARRSPAQSHLRIPPALHIPAHLANDAVHALDDVGAGHQRAIAVGISFAAEKVAPDASVIVMDSDGEDKPDTIADLREVLGAPDVDVAVAERRSRIETLRFRTFCVVYKFLFCPHRGGFRLPWGSCS